MESDRICRLRNINRAIMELDAEFQSLFGLNLNEGMALCTVNQQGRMSAGELSSELGLTTSNMSKVLSSAEKKGLLVRTLGPTDRRSMIFRLTPEGKRRLDTVRCDRMRIPDILSGLF